MNSLFITSGLLSAVLAVFSVLSDALNIVLGKALKFGFDSAITMVYGKTGVLANFILYFTALLLSCTFALLYGALDYKIGKAFRAIFWVVFGLLWFVLPVLQYFDAFSLLINAFKWYFGYNMKYGILHTSLHFAVTSLLLGAVTYLIALRQPQRD